MGDSADIVEWVGNYQHDLQLKEELERKATFSSCHALPTFSENFLTLPQISG
jgi:hypothetical protein